MKKDPDKKVLSVNRKARHGYTFLETWEAGLVLLGTEVKAIREGKVTWADAYASFERGELWLRNMHIGEYREAGQFNHPPLRARKCLLHRRELALMQRRSEESGLTLIPAQLYLERGMVKVTIALAQGRKDHDKREAIKSRDAEREMRRAMRQ